MGAIERAHQEHHQALLDAHAAYLRGEGCTYRRIAEEMGCSVSVAYDRVMRAFGRMAGPDATTERQRMLKELDDLAVIAYGVLERTHVAISPRGVVTMTVDGRATPVIDDGPVLEAVDTLLRIQTRRAKLLGTDAPSKRTVEVLTKTQLTAAIEQMQQEMAAADDREGQP